MKEKKDTKFLPGKVPFTPQLKRQREVSYISFLKNYQKELIKNKKLLSD